MAVGGNNSQWADYFPDRFVPNVLQLIVDSWQQMRPVPADAKEVPITLQLCVIMRKMKSLRNLPMAIRAESSVLDPESGKVLGRIDLELTNSHDENVYFAFECKRLYYGGGTKTAEANASQYIGESGMMCFISEKYSKGLPIGGMIGYVLSGDVKKATELIGKRIVENRYKLSLKPNTSLDKSSHFPTNKHLAESVHLIAGRGMVLYHVLLAN